MVQGKQAGNIMDLSQLGKGNGRHLTSELLPVITVALQKRKTVLRIDLLNDRIKELERNIKRKMESYPLQPRMI